MNVDAFCGETDLAGIAKGAHGYLTCGRDDVDVWEDDRCVIASAIFMSLKQAFWA